MRRRVRRVARPWLEPVEAREMTSTLYGNLIIDRQLQARRHPSRLHLHPMGGVTSGLVGNAGSGVTPALAGGGGGGGGSGGSGGGGGTGTGGAPSGNSSNQLATFVPSTTSIANPSNQGPQGTNLALNPTGTLNARELKREQFSAVFRGPYSVGPGRTSTEAFETFIRGAGTASTILHGDIQLRIITPKDPAVQIGSVSAIFDRNLNSNTVLGFDGSAPQLDANGQRINIDNAGRPNHMTQLSIDANVSSGVYNEAYSIGTVDIRYIPDARHAPGLLSQGTAVVTIRAQIYAPNVDFILTNSDINP